MKIAYISAAGRGETDRLMSEAAAFMASNKVRCAGIVKDEGYSSAFSNGCDMKVQVLPDGPVIKITQDLGEGSDACRLNPAAIAEAVARVENGALEGSKMFLLNKFGPEEVEGRGFRGVIGRALELDIPVLVGVGNASRKDFEEFAGGLAEALPADSAAIREWCLAAVAQ